VVTNVKITIPVKKLNGAIEVIEIVKFQTELEPHEIYLKLLREGVKYNGTSQSRIY